MPLLQYTESKTMGFFRSQRSKNTSSWNLYLLPEPITYFVNGVCIHGKGWVPGRCVPGRCVPWRSVSWTIRSMDDASHGQYVPSGTDNPSKIFLQNVHDVPEIFGTSRPFSIDLSTRGPLRPGRPDGQWVLGSPGVTGGTAVRLYSPAVRHATIFFVNKQKLTCSK
jgi:hypothetical protein